jgi:hypothetical protein
LGRNIIVFSRFGHKVGCRAKAPGLCPKGAKFGRNIYYFELFVVLLLLYSRDSAVGIATGYELEGRGVGVRVPVWARFFFSPRRSDRLWGPPSLLSSGYRRLFPLW